MVWFGGISVSLVRNAGICRRTTDQISPELLSTGENETSIGGLQVVSPPHVAVSTFGMLLLSILSSNLDC